MRGGDHGTSGWNSAMINVPEIGVGPSDLWNEFKAGLWRLFPSDSGWLSVHSDPSSTFSSLRDGLQDVTPMELFEKMLGDTTIRRLVSMFPGRHCNKRKLMVFFGMRVILYARRGEMGNRGKNQVLKKDVVLLRKEICDKVGIMANNKGCVVPGSRLFCDALNAVKITPEMMEKSITANIISLLSLGKFISLDERYFEFHGKPPGLLSSFSPKHWVTKVATRLVGTNLPIILGLFARHVAKDEEEYVDAIFQWWRSHARLMNKEFVLCFGEDFNSARMRDYCNGHNVRYIGALGKSICDELPQLKDQMRYDDEVGACFYKESSNETIALISNAENERRGHFVIGNILRPPPRKRRYQEASPLTHAYSHIFSVCEGFYGKYSTSWWPYTRHGMDGHLDTIFFTTLLINCHHMWMSSAKENREKVVTVHEFYEVLGWELVCTYATQ